MLDLKFINNNDINAMLNIDDIINVVQHTFIDLKNQHACSPKKFSLTLPGNSSTCMKWINSMPAYLKNEKVAGIKWISVCSENNQHNLPTTNGIIVLNDIETGMPLAICDASLITHYRSAASILMAAKLYAPKKSKVATIIGPGGQGSYSALFLQHVFNLEKLNVVTRTNERFLNFQNFFTKNTIPPVLIERKSDIKASIEESDIIIVASTSINHLLTKRCFLNTVKKDQFICGLTAFNDISPSILDSVDNVIFDDGDNAIKRIEEVSKIKFSAFNFKNILSMTSIDTNNYTLRHTGRNLYLPVGISAMDIAIANYFYKKGVSELKLNNFSAH